MIESTLKIARYCPLVIQGFSNFLGLFQGIMANPGTWLVFNSPCFSVFFLLAVRSLPWVKWPRWWVKFPATHFVWFKMGIHEEDTLATHGYKQFRLNIQVRKKNASTSKHIFPKTHPNLLRVFQSPVYYIWRSRTSAMELFFANNKNSPHSSTKWALTMSRIITPLIGSYRGNTVLMPI